MDASKTKDINIVVNGRERQVADGQTVAQLLAGLGIARDQVAVELNGDIVRREKRDQTGVSPGSVLEIVQFVGGG